MEINTEVILVREQLIAKYQKIADAGMAETEKFVSAMIEEPSKARQWGSKNLTNAAEIEASLNLVYMLRLNLSLEEIKNRLTLQVMNPAASTPSNSLLTKQLCKARKEILADLMLLDENI